MSRRRSRRPADTRAAELARDAMYLCRLGVKWSEEREEPTVGAVFYEAALEADKIRQGWEAKERQGRPK